MHTKGVVPCSIRVYQSSQHLQNVPMASNFSSKCFKNGIYMTYTCWSCREIRNRFFVALENGISYWCSCTPMGAGRRHRKPTWPTFSKPGCTSNLHGAKTDPLMVRPILVFQEKDLTAGRTPSCGTPWLSTQCDRSAAARPLSNSNPGSECQHLRIDTARSATQWWNSIGIT